MSWQGNTPSTLADVLKYIEALYAQANDSTVFFTGERHLESEGAPGRIIFLPVRDLSTLGPPRELGARQVGTIREGVRCYVWGAETTADADRYEDARRRMMRLIAAFKNSAPGRLLMGPIVRGDQTDVDTYGEEYQITIAYEWAVPNDRAIAKAAKTLGGPTILPPDPDRPEGDTGKTFVVKEIKREVQ